MSVRTGKQYVEGLRDDRRIYINGEIVRDVTKYPPLQGVIRQLGALYDRQHEQGFKEVLTYRSSDPAEPDSGEPVSTSFLIPTSLEGVERRVRGERVRAELTNGMMGRLPDYMNAYVADLAAIRDLLGRNERAFGDNMHRGFAVISLLTPLARPRLWQRESQSNPSVQATDSHRARDQFPSASPARRLAW